MGTLVYNTSLSVEIDDLTLAHLRFVIFEKLRARESFSLTCVHRGGEAQSSRSTSIWLSPGIAVAFQLSDGQPDELARDRLEELMKMSYTQRGLLIEA